MIKTLIFLIGTPFNERDYHRFGIKDLQQLGFSVCVWELTTALGRSYAAPPDGFSSNCHQVYFSKHELCLAINKLEEGVLIISCVHYSYKSYFLYRAISRAKIPYCVLNLGAVPSSHASKFSFMASIVKNITFNKIINKFFLTIPYGLMGVNSASYAVFGSRISKSIIPMKGVDTKLIPAHCFDYDVYLKNELCKDNIDFSLKGGIIFLDEYAPFHPDYQFLNIKPDADAETYYPELCRYFDYLEQVTGLNVIVAAHPRSHYDSQVNYFGNRKVLRGKTAELVSSCRLILLHASTSVNFAVIYKKPVLFLKPSSFSGGRSEKAIMHMAKALNSSSIVDFSKKYESKESFNFPILDELAYARYKNNYIKSEDSAEMPLWKIFADHIKSEHYQNEL